MLSVALVHEIGHLLLDSDDHTPSGIMRGEWDQDDLKLIRRGQAHFTSDQVRRIKANIEQRRATRAR
jgi:predicted HD phosphohydrolase